MRIIYTDSDLQKMDIGNIEKYYDIFNKLVGLFPVLETTLEDENASFEVEEFYGGRTQQCLLFTSKNERRH